VKLGAAWIFFPIWCLCSGAILNADTVVLKDGRHMNGRLIKIDGGILDFEAQSGGVSTRRKRVRLDRARVRQIELGQMTADGAGGRAPQVVLTSRLRGREPVQQQPPQHAQPAASTRTFTSDVGIVLNFVKSDKTADFETVIGKLKEALKMSPKPERQQQAAGWRVFKTADGVPAGTTLYVYFVDHPSKGTDYTVTSILAESLPAPDLPTLFKTYVDSYAAPGQNFLSLALVSDLGK
jgi:hypothetical protein